MVKPLRRAFQQRALGVQRPDHRLFQMPGHVAKRQRLGHDPAAQRFQLAAVVALVQGGGKCAVACGQFGRRRRAQAALGLQHHMPAQPAREQIGRRPALGVQRPGDVARRLRRAMPGRAGDIEGIAGHGIDFRHRRRGFGRRGFGRRGFGGNGGGLSADQPLGSRAGRRLRAKRGAAPGQGGGGASAGLLRRGRLRFVGIGRQRRQRLARQRQQCRDRRARALDHPGRGRIVGAQPAAAFRIDAAQPLELRFLGRADVDRQPGLGLAVRQLAGAVLEHVVHPPQRPHALGEMRVEVAVEDGVANRAVAVARPADIPVALSVPAAAVIDVVGEALTRPHGLAVQIAAAPRIVAGEPLMGMQVKDMRLFRPGVEVPEHHRVVQIGVVHVRRVVREPFQQGRVAIGPGGQEELLIKALGAGRRRADALAVGQQQGAHARGAVIDREAVAHPGKLAEAGQFLEIAGVIAFQLVVEEHREFAEGAIARFGRGIVVAPVRRGAAQRLGRLRGGRGGVAPDHGVQVGMHQLDRAGGGEIAAVQRPGHVQHRHAVDRRLIVQPALPGVARRVLRRPGPVQRRGRDLAAIPARARPLGQDGPEQPMGDRAAVALASGRGGAAGKEMRALLHHLVEAGKLLPRRYGVQAETGGMRGRLAGQGQGHQPLGRQVQRAGARPVGRVQRRLGRGFGRRGRVGAQRLAAFDQRGRPARHRVRHRRAAGVVGGAVGAEIARQIARMRVAARGGGQQVRHPQEQQIAHIGPQHQRPRPVAVAQPHLARRQRTDRTRGGCGIQRAIGRLGGIFGHRHYVAAQREDHAEGVERAEAVIDQHLVQRDQIGTDHAGPALSAGAAATGREAAGVVGTGRRCGKRSRRQQRGTNHQARAEGAKRSGHPKHGTLQLSQKAGGTGRPRGSGQEGKDQGNEMRNCEYHCHESGFVSIFFAIHAI
ncbi:hypothetical protein PAAM106076_12335 [Paracoccus aminovorans]